MHESTNGVNSRARTRDRITQTQTAVIYIVLNSESLAPVIDHFIVRYEKTDSWKTKKRRFIVLAAIVAGKYRCENVTRI